MVLPEIPGDLEKFFSTTDKKCLYGGDVRSMAVRSIVECTVQKVFIFDEVTAVVEEDDCLRFFWG